MGKLQKLKNILKTAFILKNKKPTKEPTFAQRLQKVRQEKKLTMTELASLTNTTKNTIWNYENGVSKAPQEMLIKMADVLGVSTDYLLGRSEHPYTSTQLPEEEIFILNEIKKYPDLYNFLAENPNTITEKIYLLWALIQNEFVKRDGEEGKRG